MRSWASEAVDALSVAIHLCELDPQECKPGDFSEKRHRLRCELSALIQRGRWFFPNLREDGCDTVKEPAFRGFRHVIVHSLFRAYEQVGAMNHKCKEGNAEVRACLWKEYRCFVSEVQQVLDPRSHEAEFIGIVREVHPGSHSAQTQNSQTL
jgi:hypothetical protein